MIILIVEDDEDLTSVTADYLEDAGFTVRIAVSMTEALRKLEGVHLMLLDINLPDGSGFNLCKKLRQESNIPIIFISARTANEDKIEGLDIGGDDYVAKPFSLGELKSRIKAHLRRCYPEQDGFGDIEVDTNGRKVRRQGREIAVSHKEFDLLMVFLRHKNIVLSKEKLFTMVWGVYSDAEPSTLTVHICWLREKLEEDPSHPRYIKTVHKVGYILEAPL